MSYISKQATGTLHKTESLNVVRMDLEKKASSGSISGPVLQI
jgi:hypothetical protein